MIDLLEKISTGLCILAVLVLGISYLQFGTPDSTPSEFVKKVQGIDLTPQGKASGAQFKNQPKMAAAIQKAAQAINDRELIDKLKRQGLTRIGSVVKKKAMPIPRGTFERAQSEANWTRELKKYRSQIISTREGDTRLRIDGIGENTMLSKLGFESKDVIELLDGDILDFKKESALSLRSRFKDSLEGLRNGESLNITISRNGEPMTLVFLLPE